MLHPEIPFAALSESAGFIVCGICILVSGTVSFIAGVYYTKSATRRSIERAKRNLSSLFTHVAESIENAEQACRVLETYPKLKLSLDQLERLEAKQATLLETVGRVVDSQTIETPTPVIEEPVKTTPPPSIEWVLAPEDGVSGLPTRVAFDANLEILLASSAEHQYKSGLLLVKLDKAEKLKSRFGLNGVREFTRQFGGRIVRSMTDADAACHLDADLFAVLMPGVDSARGRKNAEAIRTAIRRHHFRPTENGPEVLVTASLGWTAFDGEDTSAGILTRCRHALEQSEKRGRNQLHVDDGAGATLCPV